VVDVNRDLQVSLNLILISLQSAERDIKTPLILSGLFLARNEIKAHSDGPWGIQDTMHHREATNFFNITQTSINGLLAVCF